MKQIAMSFEQARDRGALGMERAAARADRKNPGWTEQAADKLLAQVQTIPHKQEFTIEAVRLVIEPDLPPPPDKRAWGQVTQAALRRLWILKTGHFAPALSSNGSPKPLYVRGGAV
ncbi:MAG: hypothetical protein LCH79_16460 [Proteobacteria bacterium]|nr:hypothetical protein [Pseudomonadota bacterium]